MHTKSNRKIKGGLYLVVDPQPGLSFVLPKIEAALHGGVDVIQLWNNWPVDTDHKEFIKCVCALAHRFEVCVFINEHWQWLIDSPLDGVHLDNIPGNWDAIKKTINRTFLTGITCGNSFEQVSWAIKNNIDYISFCSMFPSSTANSCELIKPSSIERARALDHNIPIFVSGGVTLENIPLLKSLPIDGIAVVSGILKANDPHTATKQFKQTFHQIENTIL